jgi:hypothetical protein
MLAGESGYYQTCQTARFREGILHSQHPTPGLSEQMDPIKPKLTPNHAQLFNKQRHGPKPRVVGVIRVAGTQLVVEHHLTTLASRFFEWFKVIMSSTRTAVETEQWQPIWALLLADYPVPNLEIAKWNMTFTNWDNRTHGIKFSLGTPDK